MMARDILDLWRWQWTWDSKGQTAAIFFRRQVNIKAAAGGVLSLRGWISPPNTDTTMGAQVHTAPNKENLGPRDMQSSSPFRQSIHGSRELYGHIFLITEHPNFESVLYNSLISFCVSCLRFLLLTTRFLNGAASIFKIQVFSDLNSPCASSSLLLTLGQAFLRFKFSLT